ncbi:MAG: hypothetical protein COB41_00480 [Proteobacteria bacterium]|nr:MAG: hypothetical protein COB41_00480 [Pseudomonadota bacterium]
MTKILSFILCIFLSVPAFGKCDKPVSYLSKGSTVSCTGYLFSPEKELEVRLKVEKYNFLEEYSKTQQDINEILSKRLTDSQEYNQYLSKRLKEERGSKFWRTTLYFGLGVLVTGLIASNVGK